MADLSADGSSIIDEDRVEKPRRGLAMLATAVAVFALVSLGYSALRPGDQGEDLSEPKPSSSTTTALGATTTPSTSTTSTDDNSEAVFGGQATAEPTRVDKFALGQPHGTTIGYTEWSGDAYVVDLSDGSAVRFPGMRLLAITESYVIGTPGSEVGPPPTEPSPSWLEVYDRVSETMMVYPTDGGLINVVPDREPNRVWILEHSGRSEVVRLLDLAADGDELVRFESGASLVLIGRHGLDPMVTAQSTGVYRLTEMGLGFVSYGALLGYSADYVVIQNCETETSCTAEVLGAESFPLGNPVSSWAGYLASGVAGGHLAYLSDRGTLTMMNLTDGTMTFIGPEMRWGIDYLVPVGQNLVYLDEGHIKFLDGVTGQPGDLAIPGEYQSVVAGPPVGE